MRERIYSIAKRLRRAVIEGQPILIRHHADADGIGAGIAVEEALNDFMIEFGTNPQYNLYRSPSKTPFYETTDMLRISLMRRMMKIYQKAMCYIDNG